MKKKIKIYSSAMLLGVVLGLLYGGPSSEPKVEYIPTIAVEKEIEIKIEEPKQVILMPREQIELIALVAMAESEGEPEDGQRLVIDTILNRVDSDMFHDTVTEVIYAKNQFTCMWNGRIDRCYVQDKFVLMVEEEILNRQNKEVVYFTAGKYSKYGTPMFTVGRHYFSSL